MCFATYSGGKYRQQIQATVVKQIFVHFLPVEVIEFGDSITAPTVSLVFMVLIGITTIPERFILVLLLIYLSATVPTIVITVCY